MATLNKLQCSYMITKLSWHFLTTCKATTLMHMHSTYIWISSYSILAAIVAIYCKLMYFDDQWYKNKIDCSIIIKLLDRLICNSYCSYIYYFITYSMGLNRHHYLWYFRTPLNLLVPSVGKHGNPIWHQWERFTTFKYRSMYQVHYTG